MLARLLEIECVADVAVDRSGTFLRVDVQERSTAECEGVISAWLDGEGVLVERAGGEIQIELWYGPDEVRELSRAEAEEIAAKVAAGIEPLPDAATARRLRALISGRLHDAFVTHHMEKGERVPLDATISLIRADADRLLTVQQRPSLMRQLATTLNVPEAG